MLWWPSGKWRSQYSWPSTSSFKTNAKMEDVGTFQKRCHGIDAPSLRLRKLKHQQPLDATNVKVIDSSQKVPLELLEGTEIEKKDVSQVFKEAKISLSQFILLQHISQDQEDQETADSGRNSMFYAAMFDCTEVLKRKITNLKDIKCRRPFRSNCTVEKNGKLAILFFLSFKKFSSKK